MYLPKEKQFRSSHDFNLLFKFCVMTCVLFANKVDLSKLWCTKTPMKFPFNK